MKKALIAILILATACTENNGEKNTIAIDKEQNITLCPDSVFFHNTSKGNIKHLRMEYELYSNESGQWRLISPYKTTIFKSTDEYYLSNGLLDSAHYWNITYAPEEMHEYSKYKYFGDTMCTIVLKNLKNTWLDTIRIRKDNTTLTTSYQIIGKDTTLTNREIRTYKNCIAIHAFTESYKLMDGVPTLYSTDTFNQKQIADINNAQRNKNNETITSYDPKGNILQSYSVSENEKRGDSTKILNTHLYQYY